MAQANALSSKTMSVQRDAQFLSIPPDISVRVKVTPPTAKFTLAYFPSKAAQLNGDRSYEIAFLIRNLHRKTPYNLVVNNIFCFKARVFDFHVVVIVAKSQDVPNFLSTARVKG